MTEERKSGVSLTKINNVRIKTIPLLKDLDNRPVKGAHLLPNCYGNCFLCAKTNSGKSTVVYNILRHCINRRTKVILFVSTVDADDGWRAIVASLKRRGIYVISRTSIVDESGVDQLAEFVSALREEARREKELEENPPPRRREKEQPTQKWGDASDDEETQERKERPTKTKAPRYCVVFDDLASEIRKSTALVDLLKSSRHFKIKVIISSQYSKDLPPAALKQISYWFLFKSFSKDKLKLIHEHADMSVDFPEFEKIYKAATEAPYSFLYYDARKGEFRQGFDKLITT